MEKGNQTPPDIDVTDEEYAGPSAHVAALGNGVIKHLKWAGIGILGGGAYALIDPKHAGQAIRIARDTASKLKAAEIGENSHILSGIFNELKHIGGSIIHFCIGDDEMANVLRLGTKKLREPGHAAELGITENAAKKTANWLNNAAMSKEQGFGSWFTSHILGSIPFLGKGLRGFLHKTTEIVDAKGKTIIGDVGEITIKNPRWTNALTFGGAFGAIGYVSGWLNALVTGAQHGNKGKRQFERAKEQIHHLQLDNADLVKINQDLHTRYVRAASRLDNIQAAQENAARDELPPITETASADKPAEQPAVPKTEVQLSENQHMGKVAQQELAVA